VVWMLSNLGYVQPFSLYNLLRLWPILLIVAGLDILFGRRSPLIGALIGLLALAGIIYLLLAAPSLGIMQTPALSTLDFNEPVGEATLATVDLNLSSYRTSIQPVTDSNSLVKAHIQHFGDVRMTARGATTKVITLEQNDLSVDWISQLAQGESITWQIGLSPKVPIDLTINSGSGTIDADLSSLQPIGISANLGSGRFNVKLPVNEKRYNFEFNSGSGSNQFDVPCLANVEFHLNAGSGSNTFSIPQGCAAHLDVVNSGSGRIEVASWLSQLSGNDREGAWESSAYKASARHILVVVDSMGSGRLTIH